MPGRVECSTISTSFAYRAGRALRSAMTVTSRCTVVFFPQQLEWAHRRGNPRDQAPRMISALHPMSSGRYQRRKLSTPSFSLCTNSAGALSCSARNPSTRLVLRWIPTPAAVRASARDRGWGTLVLFEGSVGVKHAIAELARSHAVVRGATRVETTEGCDPTTQTPRRLLPAISRGPTPGRTRSIRRKSRFRSSTARADLHHRSTHRS